MSDSAACFAPVKAGSREPVRLAMQRLWLGGSVLPAGARLVVQHVFRSAEAEPLEAIYSFPMPRDAALRSFRIAGDGFEAHSELKPMEEAVKTYEQGIADGSLSTLARTHADGVVNLTVGNIRPGETVTVWLELMAGVELRDGGFRFRFPFTLAPAYHSGMRVARSGEEGELELPASEFGDVILPPFRRDASGLHEAGFELTLPHTLAIDEIGSPSHSIRVKQDGAAPARVALAPEKDVPNRDLVLDVSFAAREPEVLAGTDSEGKRSFAVIAPSTVFGDAVAAPRRVAILLDRSGSMQGAPITQARKAIEACLAVLSGQDSFGLIAFDDRVESMHPSLLPGTRENRARARAFLGNVDARGGTELASGVSDAARMLAGGGDVVVLTDGQVMGTEAILGKARAAGVRLHCLGIGSASQDRFLTLLARETGGVSRFVTPRERVDLAAVDLFASIGRPVAGGLQASPDVQPPPPALVFAGTPVLLFGALDAGASTVTLTWEGGRREFAIPAGDAAIGETLRLLRGARMIGDWESRYPAEEAVAPLERRKQSRIAARLHELSKAYGLASREMSLVAVVKRAGDRPGDLPVTRVVPVGMAQDVAFDAYFGAPAAGSGGSITGAFTMMLPSVPPPAAPLASRRPSGLLARVLSKSTDGLLPAPPESEDDGLLDLASELESDGGMPGDSPSLRLARTVAAVLAFVAAGHTLSAGAFRSHVARLVAFLRSAAPSNDMERRAFARVIGIAASGAAPKGDWLKLARGTNGAWKKIGSALGVK
jgi:Ca-activated chloride channel homolog